MVEERRKRESPVRACEANAMIRLGVDTLCWHLRLENGAVTLEDVLEQAAGLEAEFVQVNLHHVRGLQLEDLGRLAARADGAGPSSPRLRRLPRAGPKRRRTGGRHRADPCVARARRGARQPILRVVSGFYRAELMGQPELIEAERRYVVDVLRGALPAADAAGVALLLENHSDFTVDEYRSLVAEAGGSTGVFLDLINPIAALDDPVPAVQALAPLARAGHVKDYVFESIPTDDGYHRRGFAVRYRYPGRGRRGSRALDDDAAGLARRARLRSLRGRAGQLRRRGRSARAPTPGARAASEAHGMRAVVFTGAGGNEVVSLEERPDPEPGPEDVVVRVEFAGLNPADLAQRGGSYPAPPGSPPDVPGLEVAGTVESCGQRVSSWQPGDRVFGLVGGGGLADRVLVHERCVARVPDALGEQEAAAVPEAFITAHDAAFTSRRACARARRCSYTAPAVASAPLPSSSGVAVGARVVATVRTPTVAEAVTRSRRGGRARGRTFQKECRSRPDVILELVGATHFPANLDVLARRGRIVVVSVAGGNEIELPLGRAHAEARDDARDGAPRTPARGEGDGDARVRAGGRPRAGVGSTAAARRLRLPGR